MKIGYVVKRYPRYSETFIVNEILEHERAGLDIEIFALRPPTDSHFQGAIADVRAAVHYVDPPAGVSNFWSRLSDAARSLPGTWPAMAAAAGMEARDVFQAVQLAVLGRDLGVDVLHAHFATSATDVARLTGRITRIPFTFTAHAKDIFHQSVDTDTLRRKLHDAAAVVTVSDYNLQYLHSSFPDVSGNVRRIYNGLDLPRFPFTLPGERERRIVAVGRLVEKKGFDVLVEACGVLRKNGIAFHCDIIGQGDQEQTLRNLIDRFDLGSHVTLTGPLPLHRVKEEIQKAAVVAAPCVVGADGNRDGLPTVLLESMALGTPCVSTDVTGIPEAIRHDVTGLIVPQRNARQLARALATMLGDPELRCRIAREARSLIESSFDVAKSAAALRGVFADAVRTPRSIVPVPSRLGKVA